jgi:hypothetical protein
MSKGQKGDKSIVWQDGSTTNRNADDSILGRDPAGPDRTSGTAGRDRVPTPLPARKVLRTLNDTVPDMLLKTDITGGIGPEGAVGGAVSGLTEEHEHGTPTVEHQCVDGVEEEAHNHTNQQRI